MLLAVHFQRGISIAKELLFLVKAAFFIVALCFLDGCGSVFIKRVELQRPADPLQSNSYEDNKITIVSTIDRIASDNNMPCRTRQGVARYCSQPPRTLVAFEDKRGFSICLFMLGAAWDKNKFLRLAGTLEGMLISRIVSDDKPMIKMSFSDSKGRLQDRKSYL